MSRPPYALRSGVLARPGEALGVLWRFSYPHTILGTTAGIAGLYAVAVARFGGGDAFDLACTLVAGWCVNVFIVGVNQLEDVGIDRVNKPWLPLPSGDLTVAAARRIVVLAGVVPVAMALTQGAIELVAVVVALALGAAYSLPPLRLKRFPVVAALSITSVRTVVVNLGVWLHFEHYLGPGERAIDPVVWALCGVTLPFAFAIAILKDMADIEGDRRFGVRTFSVRLGVRPVLRLGMASLTAGLGGMALAGLALDGVARPLVVGGEAALLGALWAWRRRLVTTDSRSLRRFYMGVWALFFAQYALLPLAAVLAG